jgi:outer membrane protein
MLLALLPTALLLVAAEAPVNAQDSTQRVLTLDEAMRIARDRQPELRQARARSEAAEARARQALAELLPQVVGSASYQRTTANFVLRPGFVPERLVTETAPASFSTFNFFNFEVGASELIYDFGRTTGQWRAARASAEAEEASRRTTLAQAMLQVQAAYFESQARRALVKVARQTLANQDQHLRQVQGFVEVGARPPIDLAQVRADRANAVLQLVTADNDYLVAKAQLNQAMGVEQDTDYQVADVPPVPVPGEELPVDVLVEQALRARPELDALARQVRAQELTVRALKGSYGPSLGVGTAFSDAGEQLGELVWNWNITLTLTWAMFRGGGDLARVREAEADLRALEAQVDALRLAVRVQVDQARLGVRAARAAIGAAEDALANARLRLELAQGRYQTGIGSIIELSDAQVALTNAAAQRVQADYNLAAARANLQRSLGLLASEVRRPG